MFLVLLLAFLLVLGVAVALWSHHHFNYWQRRGVPYIPATPLVGNVKELLRYDCCFGDQFKLLYDHGSAKGQPFVGIHVLHNHAILLRDPELIKRVMVRDFSKFSSRFETTDPIGDSMGSLNLFFAKYEIWKDIHNLFSPLFAHGKVKQMYPLLEQIGLKLETHLAQLPFEPATNSTVTEVKEMCALFTTDLIASLAFGVQANSLENPKAEFRQMCIEVNDPRPKRIFHLFVMFFFPQLVRRVRAHLFSPEYERFMRKSVEFVIKDREASGLKRNDLIDIFIHLKQLESNVKSSVVNRPDFFVAQAAFLLLAGFDTSSSTITFALYELAKHPELQQRLRAEIREALQRDAGSLSYETMQELGYLRMVVDEVLRLYPPTAFLDRCCTSEGGYALEPFSDFVMPKGMPVYISVLGLHRDGQLWPEPDKFDPERFSPENRKSHIPMSYLPFGNGPRGCIGSVLGLLQVKTGLVHILKNYTVEPCDKTLKEMKFDPKTFVLAAHGGTFLRFVRDKLY